MAYSSLDGKYWSVHKEDGVDQHAAVFKDGDKQLLTLHPRTNPADAGADAAAMAYRQGRSDAVKKVRQKLHEIAMGNFKDLVQELDDIESSW